MRKLLLYVLLLVTLASISCAQEKPDGEILSASYDHVKRLVERFNSLDSEEQKKSGKNCDKLIKMGDKLVRQGNPGLAYVRYLSAISNKPLAIAFLKEGEAYMVGMEKSTFDFYGNFIWNKMPYQRAVNSYGAAWVMVAYYNDTSLAPSIVKQLENKIQCFSEYFELHGTDENSRVTEDLFLCVDIKPTLSDLVK